jgi:catechol 2,3-dioxygenase-like lactoylglutathione lyase family enzyme
MTDPIVTGTHTIVFSTKAEEMRAFFRDILGLASVDAGEGWLIFALPPGELAVHPETEEGAPTRHELYLMCEDIDAALSRLREKRVECSDVVDQGWGRLTALTLPDGSRMGLYEPQHPTAIG